MTGFKENLNEILRIFNPCLAGKQAGAAVFFARRSIDSVLITQISLTRVLLWNSGWIMIFFALRSNWPVSIFRVLCSPKKIRTKFALLWNPAQQWAAEISVSENKLRFEIQNMTSNFEFQINPHAPDRFTPLRARCAENCGSALTHRYFGKK